ncbi:MAG: glutamate--cysteine ligase [Gammaproteobacteria bacterium]
MVNQAPEALARKGVSVAPDDEVPHLVTAQTGPLLDLERRLLDNRSQIEAWFRRQWQATPPPFYTSVDLRNAGFKVAPVDTNLFPAGFNNLDPSLAPLAIQAIQAAMDTACPGAVGILLVPESHTRNLFYLESVATLAGLIESAGYEVRIGALIEDQDTPLHLETASGRPITLEPLRREGRRVCVRDFSPCAVLLNNDLMNGRPALLEDLEQTVLPPLDLGWSDRLKSEHFTFYRRVCREFAELIGIDPWLIDPMFRNCGEINFKTRDGEECLISNVDALLAEIKAKYAEHGINEEPFVVVKADAGTYGMGIMTASHPDDLRGLNRRQRNKMAATKGGQDIHEVIIQEGVHTFETVGPEESVAEPVVYMIDRFVVGGFYRIHTQRGPSENLNAPGMHFQPLAFHQSCINPDPTRAPDSEPNRFYLYGVIGRLAMLAAAREIDDLL